MPDSSSPGSCSRQHHGPGRPACPVADTDVVDSTRLTERLDEGAASALWAAHDRLTRDLIPKWRGREVDKADGMLILFESVRDAVGYALDYQRTLDERALGIEERAGIQYGRIRLLAEALGERAHAEKNLNAVALSCLQGEVDLAEGRLERAQASLQDAIGQAAAMGVDPHRIEQVADLREAIGRALAA